jgi:hypothetical protein
MEVIRLEHQLAALRVAANSSAASVEKDAIDKGRSSKSGFDLLEQKRFILRAVQRQLVAALYQALASMDAPDFRYEDGQKRSHEEMATKWSGTTIGSSWTSLRPEL